MGGPVAFYERALGAVVEHRVVGPEPSDVIAQLSVAGAILGFERVRGSAPV